MILLAGIAFIVWSGMTAPRKTVSAAVENETNGSPEQTAESSVQVQVVKPTRGGLEQTVRQPGSVHAFEWAALFAKVSGYLKTQRVDIGDSAKQGEVLAEIEAPELEAEVQQAAAALAQAKSEVEQMKARIVTAEAKWQASVAAVTQEEAELGRATAQRVFREIQYQRIKNLFKLNSIDERMVDEKEAEMLAARSAEKAVQAAIATAKADVAAAAATIEEAKANLKNSEAKVQVAQSVLDKDTVWAGYRRIVSPYSGVVTKRTFHLGDFIRGAERSGENPLLVVERTDRLRVVTQVPDLDVPWAVRGRPATVEIEALPNESFPGVISRTAESEDPQSRTMRVEVDLPNPSGRLRPGMYGQVTINLHTDRSALVLPVSCLVGPQKDGKGAVYVVRDGKAHLVPVKLGSNDGIHVEILDGLTVTDDVVCGSNRPLTDGLAVSAVNDNQP
ncbi:MAG: efflux RND transporter periplasmic adaptor subunit [Thermoguttaceae bacterium]